MATDSMARSSTPPAVGSSSFEQPVGASRARALRGSLQRASTTSGSVVPAWCGDAQRRGQKIGAGRRDRPARQSAPCRPLAVARQFQGGGGEAGVSANRSPRAEIEAARRFDAAVVGARRLTRSPAAAGFRATPRGALCPPARRRSRDRCAVGQCRALRRRPGRSAGRPARRPPRRAARLPPRCRSAAASGAASHWTARKKRLPEGPAYGSAPRPEGLVEAFDVVPQVAQLPGVAHHGEGAGDGGRRCAGARPDIAHEGRAAAIDQRVHDLQGGDLAAQAMVVIAGAYLSRSACGSSATARRPAADRRAGRNAGSRRGDRSWRRPAAPVARASQILAALAAAAHRCRIGRNSTARSSRP